MCETIKKNQGFSLIEVIVAMVIIGIVGASFSSVVFTGSKASTSNKMKLEALMIAQDVLEEIRIQRDLSTNLETWRSTHFTLDNGQWKAIRTRDGIYFYDTILNLSDYNGNRMKEVIVEVIPQNGGQSVFLATRFRN
ncbi:hypothetical protein BHU72_12525 [Desulfuribacillus stibiiarsenatis]|uniref:Prepilin-type N-terminal cleavage/methylation domain-containing protein n=1 Tax=Desulfuribacillus stibiiarsenatis TaxID=1390249 RepID=A0A1E5L238_9FIRM|nr:type II secretion system protein [Desulfuribacillus stibiiarsenatis]OEH84222.1 hypothetical protein BHU72_12525 [Desulfuribacillus stibiiarsenatis]